MGQGAEIFFLSKFFSKTKKKKNLATLTLVKAGVLPLSPK